MTIPDKWIDKMMPVPDGCILWTGATTPAGYARATFDGQHVYVHRVIAGAQEGDHTDHLCRQTSCVNPKHLEIVTQAENNRRQAAIRTHCKHGHKWDETNTRLTPQGHRRCRVCHREAERQAQRWKARVR